MKKRILASFFIFISSFVRVQAIEWRLANSVDGARSTIATVRIERDGTRTGIKEFDGERLRSESFVDGDGTPLGLHRYGVNGDSILEVTVTDGRWITARSAGIEKTLSCRDAVVLSDSGMFWVFSLWLSRDPSFVERAFSIYQDDTNRLQQMRLRNMGIVSVDIGGRTWRAYRLEMTIPDPLAKIFWPYAYQYWYSADDFRFLAYEGPSADRKICRTEAE